MEPVRTPRCTIVWSVDGRTVEKRYDQLTWRYWGTRFDPWATEARVGTLLRRGPPPVPHARLVGTDRRARMLRFEAIPGEPLGPKFPLDLSETDVHDLAALALVIGGHRTGPARFLPRFDLVRRLQRYVDAGVVSGSVAAAVAAQALEDPPAIVFGHGDITARNVLRSSVTGEAVLIDWEWAGRYPEPEVPLTDAIAGTGTSGEPRGWDLAFLWFTLVDLPGGRAAIEAAVPARDEAWFWRSALLVQLLHLSMWGLRGDSPFRPAHERTRDELIERVLGD